MLSGWSQSQQLKWVVEHGYEHYDNNLSSYLQNLHPYQDHIHPTPPITNNGTSNDATNVHPTLHKNIFNNVLRHNGRKLLSTVEGSPNIVSDALLQNARKLRHGGTTNHERYGGLGGGQSSSGSNNKNTNPYNFHSQSSLSSFRFYFHPNFYKQF